MLILTVRTDKPEAEIGVYQDEKPLNYVAWQADRELAETIHQKLQALLTAQSLSFHDIEGIAVFKGPGSFTGLRIGISVSNALADGLKISIVGATGEAWLSLSLQRLTSGQSDTLVVPEYGSPPHITQPRK